MRRFYWSTTKELTAYVWAETESAIPADLEDVSRGATEEQMRSHPVLSEALDRWRAGEDTTYAIATARSMISAFLNSTPAEGQTWSEHPELVVCREHMDIPECAAAVDLATRIDAIMAEVDRFGRDEWTEEEHELYAQIRDVTGVET